MASLTVGMALFVAFAPLFQITSPHGQISLFGFDLAGKNGLLPIIWSGLAGVTFILLGFVSLLISVYQDSEEELWCGCCFVVVALMAFILMPLELGRCLGGQPKWNVAIKCGYWVLLGLMVLPPLCLTLEKAIGRINNYLINPSDLRDSIDKMSS